jgi:hypothetical protein
MSELEMQNLKVPELKVPELDVQELEKKFQKTNRWGRNHHPAAE